MERQFCTSSRVYTKVIGSQTEENHSIYGYDIIFLIYYFYSLITLIDYNFNYTQYCNCYIQCDDGVLLLVFVCSSSSLAFFFRNTFRAFFFSIKRIFKHCFFCCCCCSIISTNSLSFLRPLNAPIIVFLFFPIKRQNTDTPRECHFLVPITVLVFGK